MTAYDRLVTLTREASLLSSSSAVLSWDQEVTMPPGGIEIRAQQLALLARLHHERVTAPEIGDLLSTCEADAAIRGEPLSAAAVNVRELRHEFTRQSKLPASLVEEEARLASLGQHTWAEARKRADFSHFRPVLEKIVHLLRQKAACYGWAQGGEAWDALADDYERGCTAKYVESVFRPLRPRLTALLGDLTGRGRAPSNRLNETALDVAQQAKYVRFIAESIGFDFQRGRLDTSTHPFCTGFHPGDVRLTTRYKESCMLDGLGSVMHECGHGIYEQGLPAEQAGLPMCRATSLGIHESQSRMWENQVGRSERFWRWAQPKLADYFGGAVNGFSFDEVYGAANIVEPGFIRVEADEATYNLHVMVRFEIERALLAGELAVADIPGVWNNKYKEYLGLTVPDDAKGCLQDIHWSMTAMGYFPTYTLGNLYAAQFFEQARREMPGLEDEFAQGRFGALRGWLNGKIHAHGRRYMAADLCREVTGAALSAEPLMRHLEGKLRPIYGV